MTLKNINSNTAINILSNDPNAILIDVRTNQEWNDIGTPDLSKINKTPIFISWKLLPHMSINENFEQDLIDKIKNITNSSPEEISLIFICRSGSRSMESAIFMSDLGYKCFNFENGFEGDADHSGERSNINGWKFNNQSWIK
jgi:rhodanese-related sulfurtransferase